MKKIILMVMVALLVSPVSFAFENMKKHTKIEKDQHGGYTDTQKDYHKRMSKQVAAKKKGAYYNSKYHVKSPEFKQGENQFIKSAGKK